MNRETFNYLLLFAVITYIFFIIIIYKFNHSPQYNGNRFLNSLSRTKNGLKRFIIRFNNLWPMHAFFLLLLFIILIVNKFVDNFSLENYLVTFGSLIITVYFIDFLNSEQHRRETANMRYTVDTEFSSILSDFEYGIHILLFYDTPDENGYYNSKRIFYLSKLEIEKIITKENFWQTKINLSNSKGFDYETNKSIFLNDLLERKRKEVNLLLVMYSTLLLNKDFQIIYKLRETLNSFYFQKESDFPNMNQEMITVALEGLIEDICNSKAVNDKWY